MRRSIEWRPQGSDPIRFIGAHDALTARLGEAAGFDGIWASGLEITASHAVPDKSILCRDQTLERVEEMVASVRIPVLVDGDTGFAETAGVGETVRLFESAGAAGIVIEDQVFPKRNSFLDGQQQLLDRVEFCRKLAACLNSRKASSFAVIARTEALIVGAGEREAVTRSLSYLAAGVDAVIVHSKASDASEVQPVCGACARDGRVGLIPTTYFRETASRLGLIGASFVIYANHGLRAEVAALRKAFDAIIRTGSSESIEREITPVKEVIGLYDDATAAPVFRIGRQSFPPAQV